MELGHDEPDAAVVQRVIETLEHICLVPGMWLGIVSLERVLHFDAGFYAGLDAAFDLTRLKGCRREAIEHRGYRTRTQAWDERADRIRERYPEEPAAAVEWISVELEAWKRFQDLIQ
jgi:hypothetical protein